MAGPAPGEQYRPEVIQRLFDRMTATHPAKAAELALPFDRAVVLFRLRAAYPQTPLDELDEMPDELNYAVKGNSILMDLRAAVEIGVRRRWFEPNVENKTVQEKQLPKEITIYTPQDHASDQSKLEEDLVVEVQKEPRNEGTKPFELPPDSSFIADLASKHDIPKAVLIAFLSFAPGFRSVGRHGTIVQTDAAEVLIPLLKAELIQGAEEKVAVMKALKEIKRKSEKVKRKEYPRADKETGVYIDPNQREHIPHSKIANRLNIPNYAVPILIGEVPSLRVVGVQNRPQPYYSVDALVAQLPNLGPKLTEYNKAKRAQRPSRSTFVWPEDMINAADLGVEFDLNARIVGELLVGMPGRKNFGAMGVGFPRDEARRRLPELRKQQLAASDERRKVDPAIAERETLAALCESNNITIEQGRRIVRQTGLDFAQQGSTKFYGTEAFATAVHADKERQEAPSGIHEIGGENWANKFYYNQTTGVSYTTLDKIFISVPSTTHVEGEILFREEDADVQLAPYTENPRVDPKIGTHTDDEGEWGPMNIMHKRWGISVDKLKKMAKGTPAKTVITTGGIVSIAYNMTLLEPEATAYVESRQQRKRK